MAPLFALLLTVFAFQPQDGVLQILKASLSNAGMNQASISAIAHGEGTGGKVVLVLYGTVPTDAVQLKEVENNARKALENAGKWQPYQSVDSSRLVCKTQKVDEQILKYLRAETLFFVARDEFEITNVKLGAGNKMVLEGTIAKESSRALAARECNRFLDGARQRADIAVGPLISDPAAMERAPTRYFRTIQASLLNDPEAKRELGGVDLVYADLVPQGGKPRAGAILVGSSPDAAKSAKIKEITARILKNSFPEVVNIDNTRVFLGTTEANKTRIIDSLLPEQGDNYLMAQSAVGGQVRLVGRVPDVASADHYIDKVSRILFVENAEPVNVIIGETNFAKVQQFPVDPARALRNRDPQMLLASSLSWITKASPYNQSALDGWYYRAAAHLMLGNETEAAGDLVAARFLEKKFSYPSSFALFEGFQGPLREKFENLYTMGLPGQ